MPSAHWSDGGSSLFPDRGLPSSECLAFALNTFLCDVAVLDIQSRSEILEFQVSLLADLGQLILSKKQETGSTTSLHQNGVVADRKLSKRIVPLFFGLCRSMGRFGNPSEPLFLKLFPKPSPPISTTAKSATNGIPSKNNRSFSNFRSIIPQSLSATVFANIEAFPYQPANSSSQWKDGYVPVKYFRDFGSSFDVYSGPLNGSAIQYSVQHLETILQLARSCLLDKSVLRFLDGLAGELYAVKTNIVDRFPYKSFSE